MREAVHTNKIGWKLRMLVFYVLSGPPRREGIYFQSTAFGVVGWKL
jgi:hypothetical protein